jgi:ubiquitin-protein ligase
LKSSSKSSRSGNILKRITKEIQDLISDPHPSFSVFPNESDVMFWNVFMNGPETTPYEGGLFHLYVKFPSDYPFKPPSVRFVTPVYHCNINSNGTICLSVLRDSWSPALTMRKIFDSLYGLLLTPEPMDPLDAFIASEYRMDYESFVQHATEHTRNHASASIEQLMQGIEGKKNPPPQFLCGITGKVMTDPVLVVKSNNCYERIEIERVVETTGIEPKTGERVSREDLVSNVALMCAIQEFHKQNASNP